MIAATETGGTDYRVRVGQGGMWDESDANFTIVHTAVAADFNGDGQVDILWRYYGTGGSNLVWFLGNTGLAGQPLLLANPQKGTKPTVSPMIRSMDAARMSAVLREKGAGKTPTTGKASTDLQDMMRVQNRRGGRVQALKDPRAVGMSTGKSPALLSTVGYADPRQIALARGSKALAGNVAKIAATVFSGSVALSPVSDLNWEIRGTGDFNGDGNTDILWRYNAPGGYNVVWYMTGTNVTGIGVMPEITDLNWQIVGTGDFNLDGNTDILWRYNGAGGYNVVWYMTGINVTGIGVMPEITDLNWQIAGAGDFNNDTFVDVLWRYNGPGGYNVLWYMNGTNVTGVGVMPEITDLSWQIGGVGDFNNDTLVDVLWRHNGPGGDNIIWYMNGTNATGLAVLSPMPDLNWRIVSR